MNIQIRGILNDEELLAVGRLRYEVTVEEMGLSMKHANHDRRTVVEPLDYSGHVCGAWYEDQLIGTLRQNLVRNSDIGYYYKAYGVSQLPAMSDDLVSVTTRLAIDPRFRRGRLAMQLAEYGYDFLLANGITHDVIDSRPRLVPFFNRLGYRRHLNTINHPEFGEVVVQYLALNDENHLRKSRSPFLKHLLNEELMTAA